MSQDKMGDEFEEWHKRAVAQLIRCGALDRAKALQEEKPLLGLVWDESREAIVVELPIPRPAALGSSIYEQGFSDGKELFLELCQHAIEAAGLKVKR